MTLLERFGEGLHPDIPGEDYYARTLGEANSGSLKLILQKSLLHYHYWATQDLTDEELAAESQTFAFGRAYHCALLEPDRYESEYVIEPYFGNLQSSRVRAERAHWRDRHNDKGILTLAQHKRALAMARVLRAHPTIGPMVSGGGETELTVVWRDPVTGLPCKARLDWFNRQFAFVLDPKTCEDASDEGASRAASRFYYHLQAVHYIQGLKALGIHLRAFFFVFQEKDPPYVCNLLKLDVPDEELGFKQWSRAMQRLADAMAMDYWPGYNNNRAGLLRLPAYAHYNLDELTE